MAIADSFEVKNSAKITDEDLKGYIKKLQTKSEPIFAITNSGSPMSFLKETTARRLQQNDSSTIFNYNPTVETTRNLACYMLQGEYNYTKRMAIDSSRIRGLGNSFNPIYCG